MNNMPTLTDRKLRVFLCHASQDKPVVRELYHRLLAEGWIDPWLDEEQLLPGQDWDMEIEKAVEATDAVIVCLSENSIKKDGYIHKELRKTLNIADEKPDGTIFIIPLRLSDCQVPYRLKMWQRTDYFSEQKTLQYAHLLKALRIRFNEKNAKEDEENNERRRLEQIQKEIDDNSRREKQESILKEIEENKRTVIVTEEKSNEKTKESFNKLLKANTGNSTYIFGAAIILFLVGVLTYALLSNNFSPNPVSPLVLTATSTPSLVTNTPRFTATTTRVTPTLIYTSTPTPDYENFEPRLAPEDEKIFFSMMTLPMICIIGILSTRIILMSWK
jgi:hypothetical protein